ncbi:hypothetical protein PIB30_015747 [Stylosanthes scabra]|uniref:RING-CH-type domain-containing protein n=1 Tax=Stylosanthes scabra TaxID=79078 RepID=A0ABU6X6E4_9FABA|nr:hypothetical protein [Stylosanthes scabra]
MSMLVTEDGNNNNSKAHFVVDIDNNVSQGSGSSCVGNEGCASSETSEEQQQQQSSSHDSGSEIVAGAIEKERGSSVSSDQCSVELVDLESDVDKVRHLDHNKVERDCRICHLSMDMTNHESGGSPIELGCSCKDDLAAAHKHCAEAWFKIKGNKTCEICGSIAHNVAGTIEKLGVANSKRVLKLFYKAPVAVVSEHVQYSPFVINSDDDLEHPPSIHIGGSSSLPPPAEPAIPVIPPLVASPSFAADLHPDDDDECDLDDNRTFGELVTAIASNPRSPQIGVQISEPEGVEEALREDEEEEEPELIADDSDEDDQSIPPLRRAPCSSGSHQYPKHFSSLDLESIAPTLEENDAGAGFGGGSSVDVLTPATCTTRLLDALQRHLYNQARVADPQL